MIVRASRAVAGRLKKYYVYAYTTHHIFTYSICGRDTKREGFDPERFGAGDP